VIGHVGPRGYARPGRSALRDRPTAVRWRASTPAGRPAVGPARRCTTYAAEVLALHFDYPSPASAVAVLRLQRIADDGGDVRFVGIDSLGVDLALPPTVAQLAEWERCREPARVLGLELRRPQVWSPTLRAHLVGELAEDVGLGASWRSVCLHAYWGEGADLDDEEVLLELAVTAGLERPAVAARLGDEAWRRASRQRAVTQRRRGVGGVPVLESNGTLLPADLSDDDLRQLAAR
jgi:2-hydroxychromene-2-carboxylate isomerase